jgi:hypothetical protein
MCHWSRLSVNKMLTFWGNPYGNCSAVINIGADIDEP